MIVANGSTDVTTYWVLRDSTTHAPKTSVTITDIDIYYVAQGAAISAKADLTALAAADSEHADNKGYEIGQGLYRIDWPDEAFNGGDGKTVTLIVVCSGVDTTYLEVELSPTVYVGLEVIELALETLAGEGFATETDSLKVLSDKLDGTLSADVVSINSTTITGDGSSGNPWGPA